MESLNNPYFPNITTAKIKLEYVLRKQGPIIKTKQYASYCKLSVIIKGLKLYIDSCDKRLLYYSNIVPLPKITLPDHNIKNSCIEFENIKSIKENTNSLYKKLFRLNLLDQSSKKRFSAAIALINNHILIQEKISSNFVQYIKQQNVLIE